jgi:hypothetical protein
MSSPTKAVSDWIIGRRDQEVYFRKFPDGDIIAIFPKTKVGHVRYGAVWDSVLSYLHSSGHDAANETIVIQQTVPAKPMEYASLVRELRKLGYDLRITVGPL